MIIEPATIPATTATIDLSMFFASTFAVYGRFAIFRTLCHALRYTEIDRPEKPD
jgi:hypothetical protein